MWKLIFFEFTFFSRFPNFYFWIFFVTLHYLSILINLEFKMPPIISKPKKICTLTVEKKTNNRFYEGEPEREDYECCSNFFRQIGKSCEYEANIRNYKE